jgi:hypothetical protein
MILTGQRLTEGDVVLYYPNTSDREKAGLR